MYHEIPNTRLSIFYRYRCRPRGQVRGSGSPMHQSSERPCTNSRMVRATLASWSDISRSASALGCWDTAAVGRHGDRSGYTNPIGIVLTLWSAGSRFTRSTKVISATGGAWDIKPLPTFADAMAIVRQCLWPCTFSMSDEPTEMVKIPRALLERLTDTLSYAAWMDKVELSNCWFTRHAPVFTDLDPCLSKTVN